MQIGISRAVAACALGLFLAECTALGPLQTLDWNGTRLVARADLGFTQASLWLGGGFWPVAEFDRPLEPVLVWQGRPLQ